MSAPAFKQIKEVAPGFYHVRSSFKVLMGMLDVGTHMAFVRLANGNLVALDTVKLHPELKSEIDQLTENGSKLQAVIGTHPFHSLYFKDFHAAYPGPKYFGTPRHLKVLSDIPWTGETMENAKLFEPDLQMRIPAGSEYVDPKPPTSNHFCNVFVYHPASKTVFDDDCISVINNPGMILRLFGVKDGELFFHPSIKGPGLLPTKEAPQEFKTWVHKMVEDWDFDNLCTAHNANKIGGAREAVRTLITKFSKNLDKISDKNARKEPKKDCGAYDPDAKGPECG